MSRRKERLHKQNLRCALECRCIHQGYPEGTSCFDVQRIAKENPKGYTEEFRKRILRGETLCTRCAAVESLSVLSVKDIDEIVEWFRSVKRNGW